MVECSRTFVTINLPNDLSVKRLLMTRQQSRRSHNIRPRAGEDDVPDDDSPKSMLENYMAHDPTNDDLQDISYYEIIKQYTWNKTRKCWSRRQKKEPIVQIYPRNWEDSLKPDPTMPHLGRYTSKFATAARRALMLYVPFDDIYRLSDITQHSDPDPNRPARFYDPAAAMPDHDIRWRDCFLWEIEHRSHLFPSQVVNLFHGIAPSDFDMEVDPDSESEWDPTPQYPRRQDQEWQRAARIPQHGLQARMGRPSEYFGTRDIDLQHDWNSNLQQFELVDDLETFLESHQRVAVAAGFDQPILTPEMLNEGQREVYDHLVEGFNQSVENLNTIVMGTAGVGKSFLIRALEHGLWRAAREKYGEQDYPTVQSVVRLAAFTGKAAFQVKGVTIHSLLSIGSDLNKPDPLRGERLQRLQNDLKNVHFLFLDEMSMIGTKLLTRIDTCLRECRPQFHDKPFGGVSIVLFGDYGQLPPVCDTALYAPTSDRSPPALRHASMLYRQSFTSAFNLTQQMRQQGQTEMDLRFQLALSHLRLGNLTIEDWEFFQSRVLSQLPLDEQHRFRDVIQLF
jgi:PIF1-like helicase